jgi:hypothetical protein
MSNSNNSSQAPGQNKTVTIIINGRPREVTGKTASYEEIVKLAFPDDPSNQDIDFTVAYANPHGKDGELVAGQEVRVKEGMVFNVTKTNRS